MFALASRCVVAEVMDDPAIDAQRHRQALRGLARLNRLSLPARALWRAIEPLAPRGSRLRLLDVACGSGDVVRAVQRRAAAAGVVVDAVGVDVSATAVQMARQRAVGAGAGGAVAFECLDALAQPLPRGFDIVMCSLFLHHLDDDAASRLLRAMAAAAGQRVLVDDLARGTAGLALAAAVPALVSRSAIVRVDARRSVRAAFTPGEAAALAAAAGLRSVRVTRHWPQRFLLQAAPANDRGACR